MTSERIYGSQNTQNGQFWHTGKFGFHYHIVFELWRSEVINLRHNLRENLQLPEYIGHSNLVHRQILTSSIIQFETFEIRGSSTPIYPPREYMAPRVPRTFKSLTKLDFVFLYHIVGEIFRQEVIQFEIFEIRGSSPPIQPPREYNAPRVTRMFKDFGFFYHPVLDL